MNRGEIASKINLIQNNSEYVRVSDDHPLELYIGKNENGFPTLRYNDNFRPVKIVGNGMLEIKQIKTSKYNSLLFSFNSLENISLFYNFCEDIINRTSNYTGNDGYTEIVNRYIQWKKMFYGVSRLLSESEIMGLIGELTFLKEFALKKYGNTVGLNGWSGPEPTHKDFSYESDWFEIKTINSSKTSVTISSIEQLDSETMGNLVVYYLEKMSQSFDGITLNRLVENLLDQFSLESDRDLFIEKLKQAGYAYNEFYDNFVYNLTGHDTFTVWDDFPRLKQNNLPLGVVKVKYDISLASIERFKEK